MKKILISFLTLAFVLYASISYAEEKEIQLKEDYKIDVQLIPQASTQQATDITCAILIKNIKTGKEWKFTQSEFNIIIDNNKNWNTVVKGVPEVSKFTQDNTNVYITFNYYNYSDDKKTKTSVLSGKIIINREYLREKTSNEELFKNVIIGLSVYSLLVTIILIIGIF
jgi:hypothetical protein